MTQAQRDSRATSSKGCLTQGLLDSAAARLSGCMTQGLHGLQVMPCLIEHCMPGLKGGPAGVGIPLALYR